MFTASAATNDPDSREILVMGAAGFSHEDIRDVERVRSVRRATATYRERMTIRHGGADLEASVIAQEGEPTAALSANAAWPLETGRFITEADGVDAKRVAVIGGPVRDRLFGTEATAIGKDILIGDESFTVKGVLGPHPPFVDADLPDDAYIRSAIRVYVPLRTGVESLFRETRPTLLRVFVKDSELIGQTIAETRELLVGRHGQAIHLEPASPRGSPGP